MSNLKKFTCEYYSLLADEKSCFFCQHLTDIFFDYTNGPYMFICEKGSADHDPTDEGLKGKCNMFMEEATE
jgi:hypothetical protein